MDELKKILSNEDALMSDEELKKYLDGSLTEKEKHAFEQKTAGSDFLNDAIEGLQQFDNRSKLDDYVKQLNNNLHHQLANRKQKKQKRNFKDDRWALLAIILLLAICIIAFVVIRMYQNDTAVPTV